MKEAYKMIENDKLHRPLCPLLAIASIGSSYGITKDIARCVLDKCAFWDCVGRECYIVSAASSLAIVADALTEGNGYET